MHVDNLGKLYTKVADFVQDCAGDAVKRGNFIRFDANDSNANFQAKQNINRADLPEVQVHLLGAVPSGGQTCATQANVRFEIFVYTDKWRLRDVSPLAWGIWTCLNSVNSNICQWDIGEGAGVIRGQPPEINVGFDSERAGISGFHFQISFSVDIFIERVQ